MAVGELHISGKTAAGFKIFVTLTGKPGNDVCTYVDVRHLLSCQIDKTGKIISRVVAVHRLEDTVAAVLKRNMQKMAHFRGICHNVEQTEVFEVRLSGTQTDTEITIVF